MMSLYKIFILNELFNFLYKKVYKCVFRDNEVNETRKMINNCAIIEIF